MLNYSECGKEVHKIWELVTKGHATTHTVPLSCNVTLTHNFFSSKMFTRPSNEQV